MRHMSTFNNIYLGSSDGKIKVWKPEDWWCNKCNFKIFGTKNKCFKCGLLKSQWCCSNCHNVENNNPHKCPECNMFNSIDDEYYWTKENGDVHEFIKIHSEYAPCYGSSCCGQPRRFCWKHG